MNKENKYQYDEEGLDDRCDLDPNKICDNCCKCLEMDKNYKIIKITGINKTEKDS